MNYEKPFSDGEKREAEDLLTSLKRSVFADLDEEKYSRISAYISDIFIQNEVCRNAFGLNTVVVGLETACLLAEEIGQEQEMILATLLYYLSMSKEIPLQDIENSFGRDVAKMVKSLQKVEELHVLTPAKQSENYTNLLLTMVEDLRVLIILIVDCLNLMRHLRDTQAVEERNKVSEEANFIYAPLAHKMGLYRLKSELEDLSLKYLNPTIYYKIRDELAAKKTSRDAYIEAFIGPVKRELELYGLQFHIKGRTKSIHSIWQKMQKQQCDVEDIYDLFAIRIILEAEEKDEKMVCWQAFSIVTNMYQSNPKRLRDWLSVPKSNGYESLHLTVLGPEKKWVEVQIRTERMDFIAENGVAAHWKYKGISSESNLDNLLNDLRQALSSGESIDAMNQMRLDDYEKEVYVFSPKGDLYKLNKGATVLDFAYYIHSNIGNHCVGGRINNRIVSIREPLSSGDQVEILTQSNQTPKQDWLNIVKTPRAKSKLRLALKEGMMHESAMAKELFERRLKNRKVEWDEASVAHLVKKLGYKVASEFYVDIANGKLDINEVIEKYVETRSFDLGIHHTAPIHSAGDYVLEDASNKQKTEFDDILVIDEHLKGIEYSLAKCCNPIYGDKVFGFVTINEGIKIHREDCPNAPEMRSRFGYRIVPARWSGKGQSQYALTIRVVGNDDIGIISNITSIISKDEKTVIRSINIDTNDGLFSGVITLMVSDTTKMQQLIKKISTVKGVKNVERI